MNAVSQGLLNNLVLGSLFVSIHKSQFYFLAEFVRWSEMGGRTQLRDRKLFGLFSWAWCDMAVCRTVPLWLAEDAESNRESSDDHSDELPKQTPCFLRGFL